MRTTFLTRLFCLTVASVAAVLYLAHPALGKPFDAGLRRYLWVQIIPGTEGKKADTRFEGGFAVYDAPEPWGPWTTVYFTEKWDVGPGETASFPTKWMSGDGKTLYLVFSGDDDFAIRKASLTVAGVEKSPPK
jgi:hypothetical protein